MQIHWGELGAMLAVLGVLHTALMRYLILPAVEAAISKRTGPLADAVTAMDKALALQRQEMAMRVEEAQREHERFAAEIKQLQEQQDDCALEIQKALYELKILEESRRKGTNR